jgi:hypothetical protein
MPKFEQQQNQGYPYKILGIQACQIPGAAVPCVQDELQCRFAVQCSYFILKIIEAIRWFWDGNLEARCSRFFINAQNKLVMRLGRNLIFEGQIYIFKDVSAAREELDNSCSTRKKKF